MFSIIVTKQSVTLLVCRTGVVERVTEPEGNNLLQMAMPTVPAMLLMQDSLQLEKVRLHPQVLLI